MNLFCVSSALTKSFTLTLSTITAAASTNGAHGFGSAPKLLYGYLTCVTANLGYIPGQVVAVGSNANQSGTAVRGPSYWADATNVYLIMGSDSQIQYISNATTGTATLITAADWTFSVNAYA